MSEAVNLPGEGPAVEVRLLGVPVLDYLALEAHHDALLREFALLSVQLAGDTSSAPRRIVDLGDALERRLRSVRSVTGGAVRDAAETGRQHVDVSFPVTETQVEDSEAVLALLEEVDEFCRSGALLTMPTPPHLVALRRWLVMDVSAQVRRQAPPTRGPELASPDAHALLQAMPATVIAADDAGRIVYASPGSASLLGWTPDDLVGLPLETIIPERLRGLHRPAFARFVTTRVSANAGRVVRVPALRRDGGEVDVELTIAPFRTLRGQDLIAGTLHATAREGASPDRFLRLLDSVEGVVWEVDATTLQPLFVSAGALDLLRRPLAEVTRGAGPWLESVHPSDREALSEWRRAAADGPAAPRSRDYRVITGDGQVRWLRDRVAVADVAGRRSLLGLTVDITREQLTARRREARSRFAAILASAATLREVAAELLATAADGWGWDAGALWLVEGEQIRAVRTWSAPAGDYRDFTDFSTERVFRRGVGLPGRVWQSREAEWIAEIQLDDNFPRARVALAAGLHSGAAAPIIVGDDVIGVLEFFAGPVRQEEPDTLADLVGLASQVVLFITRRRAEEELKFQKALLECESEAALDAIIVVSDDGRVLSYNRRFAEMTNLDPDTLDAGDAQMVLDRAVQMLADPDAFVEFLGDAREAAEARRGELVLRDGRIVDCYVATLPAPTTGVRARAWYFRDITDRKHAETELRQLAYTLQQSLLPPTSPVVPGLDVATRYRYAGAGFEVGGDFYDIFQTHGAWGAMIGDVCGKGVAAASLTALVRYSARAAAMGDIPPADVLRVVNETVLREPGDDQICTIAYVRIDVDDGGARVTSVAGGHPLPVVVRASGVVETLGRPGTLLGAFERVDLADASTDLAPGDALVLYTDGVTEARAGDDFFGTERLLSLLESVVGATADEIVTRVTDAALDFQGGHPRDDIAVVVLRVPT